jgi:two-component system sensor histidine kinase/response regulator
VENRSRILIIDDEEIVLDSCLQVLKRGNYEIAVARDGAAGLKLAQEFGPDLILVDLMMPGLSGFEVLEALRTTDPTIVAIVITGYSTVGSAVEAMKKGAFDFLPKPFTPDELRLIVDRGLEKRRLVLETSALRREREMMRENFAAIVSHELKSPLSAVQQNLFVLVAELSGQLTEAQKNRFDRIKSRIDDLLKLIQTWLRAVSVPVENIRESFTPVSLRSPIAKAIETVQPHATRKDIEITESVTEPLAPVLGDEGSLTEALVNLVGNAVKYSHVGGKVMVSAGTEADGVVITVADNGVGIAPEDLPFVFDGFYRGKTAAAETGVGLGLALARRIVEAHDGTVSVESELGKGTTFFIKLPAQGADHPSPPRKAAAASPTSDSGDKP